MKHCTVIDHPLARDRLATLRDVETDTQNFRCALGQLGLILLQEATRDLAMKAKRVRTTLAPAAAQFLSREILLVPILRAGQGLIALSDQLIPEARIG